MHYYFLANIKQFLTIAAVNKTYQKHINRTQINLENMFHIKYVMMELFNNNWELNYLSSVLIVILLWTLLSVNYYSNNITFDCHFPETFVEYTNEANSANNTKDANGKGMYECHLLFN